MGLIYHLLHYVYVKLLIEEGHWTRRCYLRETFHWSFCFPELHSTTKSNMNPGFYTWQYFKVVSDSWHYCRWIKTLDFNMETALISCHLLQLKLFFFKAWSRSFPKPYPGVHYCNHDDEVPLTLQSTYLNLNQVFSVPKPDQTLTIALSDDTDRQTTYFVVDWDKCVCYCRLLTVHWVMEALDPTTEH